jgi:ATP-dependent helicase HrpB
VLLTLKATGIDNLETFPWIDPPAPETVRHALELLHDLGALNRQGSLTPIGRAMLKFPVHPRYARMLLAAETYDCKREAALIAALAQGRSILVRKIDKRTEQAREDALGRYAESDFLLMMKAWEHACNNRFRREACAELGIHGQACRQTAALYRQFLPLARADEYQPAAPVESIQRCILAAFSDQLALRRDQGTLRCQLVHGRSAELARESAVREARLFVASDIQEIQHSKRNLTVLLNLATAVNEEWLKELFPEDFNEANEAVYDPTLKRVSVVYRRQFRDLVLEQRPTGEEPDPDQAAALLAQEILAGNLSLNKWDDAIEKWITRVNCLAAWRPDWQIPPIDDEARAAIIEQICLGAVCRRDLKHRDVRPGVHSWLTPAQRQLIEQEAPERLKLPCGRRSRLRYQEGAAPVLSATIQDLYGLEKTPKIAGRQVPLQVEILAPNRRPVQITEDLASFWSGAYPEIRRQLSKRYPKHEWR